MTFVPFHIKESFHYVLLLKYFLIFILQTKTVCTGGPVLLAKVNNTCFTEQIIVLFIFAICIIPGSWLGSLVGD